MNESILITPDAEQQHAQIILSQSLPSPPKMERMRRGIKEMDGDVVAESVKKKVDGPQP